MLYIVPSPIGNLQDITLRALEVLKKADLILAEDTRNSSRLLNHYQIIKPLSPYHQHNEHKILHHLVDQLLQGKTMALITDAGTPGVSDPAFLLVRECIKTGVKVECLPGATAFVPALVNSGLPMQRFSFEGFLPIKKGRQTMLKQLAQEERTLVFYESPMRLVKTLEDFIVYFGEDRECCVSRELTKIYEENMRGSLREVCEHFRGKGVKGEIVITVAGSRKAASGRRHAASDGEPAASDKLQAAIGEREEVEDPEDGEDEIG
ncbi:16S rRNA (cytidine(1402)-2'-O)-methyltransferase [Flavitalea sp. BT771]|uniref:16S rRNA (cytidine(1402)-2'-O)-methyltransferase n=1 Tax=Flavitalea sp. BT771 TaxID=3063329 RepID=UPI0026E2ED0B|nr:16S rRNA (cytidine(1402)-2'-O)-methyltransferase [Flavitalea sp. BT771]MDO6431799.1 16S rRNA (cytidine(1402)-2'-O)-methyltransferase [Flavitalea sp. BT771]MDV6220708.1 16S rRNA (cytidine(1402)-2'-O)-methyltransferase [Flavitalea sp. BT771]